MELNGEKIVKYYFNFKINKPVNKYFYMLLGEFS